MIRSVSARRIALIGVFVLHFCALEPPVRARVCVCECVLAFQLECILFHRNGVSGSLAHLHYTKVCMCVSARTESARMI